MTVLGWLQILLFCSIVVALAPLLGGYMTRVFNGERTFLSPVLQPVEGLFYRIAGVDPKREQHWLTYTVAMMLFNAGGFLVLYGVIRLQAMLPFNPAGQSAVGGVEIGSLQVKALHRRRAAAQLGLHGGEAVRRHLALDLEFLHR